MSVPVAPDELARRIDAYGAAAFLVTVGDDGAPHVVSVTASWKDGAVVVGAGRLDAATLLGPAAGEVAVRARQAGVPAHAVCADRALTLFDQRILDLQHVLEAPTVTALEQAGERLARSL